MLLAGIDEVGRGPLAGPVVAAAVIFDVGNVIPGLRDSKKLSHQSRETLSLQIKQHALAWSIGRAEVEEIDALNIHHASLLAMRRAALVLNIKPEKVQVDGKFCPQLDCQVEAIIKGDEKILEISAASIIAKVTRDHEMRQWHQAYPEYGFDRHVGYGTKQHLIALEKYGATPLHRKTFSPVRNVLSSCIQA